MADPILEGLEVVTAPGQELTGIEIVTELRGTKQLIVEGGVKRLLIQRASKRLHPLFLLPK